jgi:serine/threonine protein phosphatase PrpC
MTETEAQPPATPPVDSAGATYIGRRSINEDTVLLRPDLSLFLLADGAGGDGAGDVASALATRSIAAAYEATLADRHERPDVDAFGLYVDARRLASAIHKANREVFEVAQSKKLDDGMGTTIVAAVPSLAYGAIHVAHVGDSRCYRLRGGLLELLTEDHSLLNDVLERWPDVQDDALTKLPRNVVTRALGMQKTVRVTMRTYELLPGDRYLLCSDGLTETVDPERLAMTMSEPKSANDIVALLMEAARELSAHDNVAAVVLSCEPPAGADLPALAFRPHRKTSQDGPSRSSRSESSEPEIVILGITEGPQVVPKHAESLLPDASQDPAEDGAPHEERLPGWREALDELTRKT